MASPVDKTIGAFGDSTMFSNPYSNTGSASQVYLQQMLSQQQSDTYATLLGLAMTRAAPAGPDPRLLLLEDE